MPSGPPPRALPLAQPLTPPIAPPLPPGPVAEGERLVTLDVLRGVAILGILLVNIAYYGLPVLEADRTRWWEIAPADGILRLLVDFFCSFKFITLFSLLFGMGLALQSIRAEQKGRSFVPLYARRLLFLLLFGIAHGTLLWYGDILTTYALLGFLAMLCHRWRPRSLLIAAACLFSVPVLGFGGCALVQGHQTEPQISRWKDYFPGLEEVPSADRSGGTSLEEDASAQPGPNAQRDAGGLTPASRGEPDRAADRRALDPVRRLCRFLDEERRIYQSGSFREMCLHRSILFVALNAKGAIFAIGWRTMALFLFGMYLIRRGVFNHPARDGPLFRRFAIFGLALGVAIQAIGFVAQRQMQTLMLGSLTYIACLYVGSLGLSLGYLGLVGLACRRAAWHRRLRPFAAVGRMALTNYLGHSILCNLIFYGHGLGLFGRLPYWAVFLVAVAIFVAQLALSPVWLRHFHFGPFEWLWRSLTYRRRQPFRRGSPA